MKLHDVKILTDENISPKVTAFLRQYGLDILDTKEQHGYGKDDEDLLSIAYQEQRFVLYLRLKNLQPQNVIRVCEHVLQKDVDAFPGTIMVIEETRIRIRHPSKEI